MLNSETITQLSDQTKFYELLNQTYDAILKNLMINQESLIKISFTVDNWSSSNKLSFLDINCYYISKNWKYQEKLIKFELLFDNYNDQNLKEIMKRIILKKNLKTHLLAIIINNVNNNSIIWKEIVDELTWLYNMK